MHTDPKASPQGARRRQGPRGESFGPYVHSRCIRDRTGPQKLASSHCFTTPKFGSRRITQHSQTLSDSRQSRRRPSSSNGRRLTPAVNTDIAPTADAVSVWSGCCDKALMVRGTAAPPQAEMHTAQNSCTRHYDTASHQGPHHMP